MKNFVIVKNKVKSKNVGKEFFVIVKKKNLNLMQFIYLFDFSFS